MADEQKGPFRVRAGFTTPDGHHYTSIPTTVPEVWSRWTGENDLLHYSSGEYEIKREPYGSRFHYTVWRDVDGKLVAVNELCSRLAEARLAAERNARGQQIFNWA